MKVLFSNRAVEAFIKKYKEDKFDEQRKENHRLEIIKGILYDVTSLGRCGLILRKSA